MWVGDVGADRTVSGGCGERLVLNVAGWQSDTRCEMEVLV